MGFGVFALAAFEVAVRGRGDALSVHRLIVVHRHAHRTAGIAPLKPGFQEDAVETFLLGLVLDVARPRHHQRGDPVGDLASFRDGRSRPQILDAAVGARADEHALHRHLGQQSVGFELHVLQGTLDCCPS